MREHRKKKDRKTFRAKENARHLGLHGLPWPLLAGCFFLLAFLGVMSSVSGLWSIQPDYCVAYVGSHELTDEMYDAIESAFLISGQDVNGDQEIVIQLRQYVIPDGESADREMILSQLTADINSCESFFFILEDPENFQYSFGLLRFTDGRLPALDDYSAAGKTVSLSDSSFFSESLNGLSASEAAFVGELSIGVRGFWTEQTCKYEEENDALWEKIML